MTADKAGECGYTIGAQESDCRQSAGEESGYKPRVLTTELDSAEETEVIPEWLNTEVS